MCFPAIIKKKGSVKMTTQRKLEKLLNTIRELESAVIGFSGGVDSAFLSAAAHRVLGERAVAVTACSATLPESEKQEAVEFAKRIGICHVLLEISELESPGFVANGPDRCYHCKQLRFSALSAWAKKQGIAWVLEGSNADDVADYRPGMKAVGELGMVRSPLLETGLTKNEIREISKEWGLPTWNKLSAACLSSRVVYGDPVTAEKLRQIEAGEKLLRQYCAGQVRLRHHGNLARIEVSPEDLPQLVQPATADKITAEIRRSALPFVTLDLAGYRMGSMNEAIRQND